MTNAGTASGATSRMFQTRRPGRVVRSTTQAAPVPMTMLTAMQPTTSRPVLDSSSATRGRATRAHAWSQPMLTV